MATRAKGSFAAAITKIVGGIIMIVGTIAAVGAALVVIGGNANRGDGMTGLLILAASFFGPIATGAVIFAFGELVQSQLRSEWKLDRILTAINDRNDA